MSILTEQEIMIHQITAVLESLGWEVTKVDTTGEKIVLQVEHDKPAKEEPT